MAYLNRTGVSEDFCQQCYVARMCDTFIKDFRQNYAEARQHGLTSPQHLEYISKMRAWCAHKLKIHYMRLISFESRIGMGLSAREINETLVKWGSPLRLSNDERWIVLEGIPELEKQELDVYLKEKKLTPQVIVNSNINTMALDGTVVYS